MNKDRILAQLRAHKAELRAAGIEKISIFGSVARGDATDRSDVDVVVRLSPERSECGFAYFGRLEALAQCLQEILGCPVDIVISPPVRLPLPGRRHHRLLAAPTHAALAADPHRRRPQGAVQGARRGECDADPRQPRRVPAPLLRSAARQPHAPSATTVNSYFGLPPL